MSKRSLRMEYSKGCEKMRLESHLKNMMIASYHKQLVTLLDTPEKIGRLADLHEKHKGLSVEEILDTDWANALEIKGQDKIDEMDAEQSRIDELYRVEKRKFEAQFIRTHLLNVGAPVFAEVYSHAVAAEQSGGRKSRDNSELVVELGVDLKAV